jgi:hypothetical protein
MGTSHSGRPTGAADWMVNQVKIQLLNYNEDWAMVKGDPHPTAAHG